MAERKRKLEARGGSGAGWTGENPGHYADSSKTPSMAPQQYSLFPTRGGVFSRGYFFVLLPDSGGLAGRQKTPRLLVSGRPCRGRRKQPVSWCYGLPRVLPYSPYERRYHRTMPLPLSPFHCRKDRRRSVFLF